MTVKPEADSAARKSPATQVKARRARSARGELARNRLKNAAMAVLERVGFHQLRVSDVTDEAGVAAGLFYHYFDDLKSLTLEVLTDFLQRLEAVDEIERGLDSADLYSVYLAHFELAVENYSRHPGLMRCLLQLSDEVPEFRELRRQSALRQKQWLARLLPKMFPDSGLSQDEALLVVESLVGMSETLLREYYISRDSALNACSMSNAEMAEFLTVMFYRGLLLESPPGRKLRFAKKLARVSRAGMAARRVSGITL
ncbi:MAG: TetR/AcrR family transcriptional regulator [Halioglobus sp.]|nr:TetR/AcrR family transcriptional regulator [Halioglobus sp.]